MGLLSFLSPSSVAGPLAGALGNFIVKEFFHELGKIIESTVGSCVKDVLGTVVGQTTGVTRSEGNPWFGPVAGKLAPLSVFVVAPLLMVATIGAILRQDLRRLGRAWAVGLPLAALGGFAAVKLAGFGLAATDGLTRAIVTSVAPTMKEDFITALSAGFVPGVGGPVAVLGSLVVLAGALLIWLELAVRSLAVEVAVFFMPLALAGIVWPSTSHWSRRFAELLGALLLVKPVVAGVLALGTAAITSGHTSAGSLMSGAALLLLAGFAPLYVLKMAPLVEVASVVHLQELSRVPAQAAGRVIARVGASTAIGAPAGTVGDGGADMRLASTLLQQTGEHPLGPARPLAGGSAGGG
jgi:hypothetical protein